MVDTIRGHVIYVVDGNTLDIEITHQEEGNKYQYNNGERIRIANIDKPELSSPYEKRSRDKLKNFVNGKELLCYVQRRDSYNRVVADVRII